MVAAEATFNWILIATLTISKHKIYRNHIRRRYVGVTFNNHNIYDTLLSLKNYTHLNESGVYYTHLNREALRGGGAGCSLFFNGRGRSVSLSKSYRQLLNLIKLLVTGYFPLCNCRY